MIDIVFPHLWSGSIVFVRVGAVLMLAPGWGEASVPTQIKLSTALLASIAIAPSLHEHVPVPDIPSHAVAVIVGEALIGIVLGSIPRLLMGAAHIAGQISGLQSGLGLAQQFDPNAAQSAATIGVFLSMMSVCLIMATGIHRLMLEAAADSYLLFPAGVLLPVGDTAQWAIGSVGDAFSLAFRIAAPVVAFGLIFNLALGLINRLIPQVQIFFVALPSSVLFGLAVTSMGMGSGLWLWLDRMSQYASLDGLI